MHRRGRNAIRHLLRYSRRPAPGPGGEGAVGLWAACAGERVRGEPGRRTGGQDVGAAGGPGGSDWDRVHVFEVCEVCSKKTRVLGTAEVVEEREFYVI